MEWQSELESGWGWVSGLYVTGTYTASNCTKMPSNSLRLQAPQMPCLYVGNAAIRSGWGLGLRIVHTPWNGSGFDTVRYNCIDLVSAGSSGLVSRQWHAKVPVSTRTAKQKNVMHPISTVLSLSLTLMSLQLTVPLSCPHDTLFSTSLSLHNILVTVIHYMYKQVFV